MIVGRCGKRRCRRRAGWEPVRRWAVMVVRGVPAGPAAAAGRLLRGPAGTAGSRGRAGRAGTSHGPSGCGECRTARHHRWSGAVTRDEGAAAAAAAADVSRRQVAAETAAAQDRSWPEVKGCRRELSPAAALPARV